MRKARFTIATFLVVLALFASFQSAHTDFSDILTSSIEDTIPVKAPELENKIADKVVFRVQEASSLKNIKESEPNPYQSKIDTVTLPYYVHYQNAVITAYDQRQILNTQGFKASRTRAPPVNS